MAVGVAGDHHGGMLPAEDRSDADDGAADGDGAVGAAPAVLEQAVLTDGTTVWVRSVEPGDAEALAEGYQQLSATSAYQRFFTIYPQLSPQQVRYFTAVDHRDHEALGAVTAESGEGVGIARYIRDRDDPACAELAVVVVDSWQRLGLGCELMRVLCRRAHEEGVTTLRAEFVSQNNALPALLRRFGTVHIDAAGTTSTAVLELDAGPDTDA